MATVLLVSTIIISFVFGSSDIRVSLNGDDWKLSNGSSMSPITASVPGQVYLPLIDAGIISHPYYGMNPMTVQWVAKSDWIYTKTFNIDQSVLNMRVVQLVANGIDSKANVSINGKLVFMNDNMFHRNVVNIKSFLKSGSNTIRVYLYNKVTWATQEHNSCSANTDGQCPGSSQSHNGFTYVNYIRTEPCSFSWDWGPAYAPVGIWKGIEIQAYNDAVVRDFVIYAEPVNNSDFVLSEQQRPEGITDDQWLIQTAFTNNEKGLKDYTSWNTKVVVFVDAGADNVLYPANPQKTDINIKADTIKGSVKVSIPSLTSETFSMNIEIAIGTEMNFTVDLSKLTGITQWMPNEWGQQQLYEFQVNFINNASMSDVGKHRTFGFREMKLIQNPLPGGKSFYFQVNGVAVVVHGSNWIPSQALDNSNASVNTSSLEPLFKSLADSHQNMIRNWGGGIYQQKDFYDLADKYGIMIWQDFMFACASYWTNPEWLKSVSKEVIDTVRDIQHHPSIAIWAANNENGGDCKPGQESAIAYVDLYWKSVLDNVAIIDPIMMRPRVSSSPSNGNETEQEPCAFNGNTQDPYYGDVHQYLYDKDCWNTDIYVKARFVSEFGWQSWPSYSTMTKYLPSDQWSYNSPDMQNRQHHPNGQAQIVTEIQNHYNLPNGWNDTKGYMFMLFASQYSQAYCYKVEVEFFRSLRNTCSSTTPGCTMGSMYWQTNDIWPGASWSGVDYTNTYKLVAQYAKNFYRKVIITGYDNGLNYTFWAINDYTHQFKCDSTNNCIIQFRANSFETSKETNTWNVSLPSMEYESAQMVYSLSHSDFQTQSKCPSIDNDCALQWRLIDTKQNKDITENWMFISSPKNTKAMDPNLKLINVKDNGDNTFEITFSNDNIASIVYLETAILGNFDDDHFGWGILYPGTWTTQFNATQTITALELQNSIHLYSLYEAGGFAN